LISGDLCFPLVYAPELLKKVSCFLDDWCIAC
jgi:hypothetical protein